MDEGKTAGTSSVAPAAPSDMHMPEGHADLVLAPSSPHQDHQGQGTRQSEQQRIEQQDEQETGSGYKASEIAERFIEAIDPNKPHVDTAAPIDSVKGAVSKFGGILDWRERRGQLQDELDKVQVEVAKYQKRSKDAEAGKVRALQELESTANVADELRIGLEKAEAEDARARREADLAELQRGASEEAAAVKAELLDTARDLQSARANLHSARAEVAALEKERVAAAADADAAAARARDAADASVDARKAVEDLAAELVALKRDLESSSAAHGAAEEARMAVEAALEQDKSLWQGELEEAQQEARRLREELMAACDLEVKTEAAAHLLASLLPTEDGEDGESLGTEEVEKQLSETKRELEEVKQSIDKAKAEAECLRFAAAAMRDSLAREKAELAALQRKQELEEASINSLEEKLSRATAELAAAEARAKEEVSDEERSKMAEQARREAEQAKGKAWSAREELDRARDEASVAKVAAAAAHARLDAVTREVIAANASEEAAAASANALLLLLQEQEANTLASSRTGNGEGVTLTTEEYEELSRRARETEDAAGRRVVEAVRQIKEAKDAEVRGLETLKYQARQTEQRRRALQAATEEAEEAEFAKMTAERELRQWVANHPRAGLAEVSALEYGASDGRANPHILSPRAGYMQRNEAIVAAGAAAAAEAEARQKKATFFPRMIMFLARKRAQSSAWK